MQGRFTEIDYSDEVDSENSKLKINILQIANIADAITKYANNFSDDKIMVHADITGGFRHTSMMMLSIMQLLKYRGIEIGEVLYSDFNIPEVYRATEIQRIFSLITGADEFVKFGSAEALKEYFGKNPPEYLKELLAAMETFSDAIKICRTADIEKDLKLLGESIAKFHAKKNKDLKNSIFTKIIDTIENEYSALIGENVNRFEIIRWCMRKGFWQQAMTLCTEWLPEEIVNRGICVPTSVTVEKMAEAEASAFGRNWQQQFIIAYSSNKTLDVLNQDILNASFL